MKICITDATYKHAIALSKYLRKYDPSLVLVGCSPYKPLVKSLFSKHYSGFLVGDLKEIVAQNRFDLVIPVGNDSVLIASELALENVVLPSIDSVNIALSKTRTLKLAKQLNIPMPKTIFLDHQENIDKLNVDFPCVVKGVLEAGKNVVSYPKNKIELLGEIDGIRNDPTQKKMIPLVQEYVEGVGLGFFGFYQNGQLKRFYMHERIRELPITGGASTAAKTIFNAQAYEYGKKILDHLKWNGVAMVEFKYNPVTRKLFLMEINPKFWGSTELGLAAGINLGALLVRSHKGEDIESDLLPSSYQKIKFLWPFDGDLQSLWQSRNWKGLLDYFSWDYNTNVFSNGGFLSVFKLLQMIRAARKKENA